MGNQTPLSFTPTVPPSPTASHTATETSSPEAYVRESIAFSAQHGDIGGPDEASSVSSLITAVNPIRRSRGSMFGRGLGQPMGIPPELDDGAPTVRVQVQRPVPRTESVERGACKSSRLLI